jgi:hypothetical protein
LAGVLAGALVHNKASLYTKNKSQNRDVKKTVAALPSSFLFHILDALASKTYRAFSPPDKR